MIPEKIIYHEVELPGYFSEEFITPDFHQLVEFYPEYVKDAQTDQPFSFQGYLLRICKDLEIKKCREGRTSEQWMKRFMEHYGLDYFAAYTRIYEDLISDKKA